MQIKKLSDAVNSVFALGATTLSVIGFVWFFIDDEVSEKFSRFTGATAALEAIVETNRKLDGVVEGFDERLAEMERRDIRIDTRLRAIEPPQKIFEIDELRSYMRDDCPTEGVCNYVFRVRRTDLGALCEAPHIRRFVIDRFGVTHPVNQAAEQPAQRAQDGWTDISSSITMPDEVPEGVAEFYMEVTYTGCFPSEPERKVRERTPKLIFTVNER